MRASCTHHTAQVSSLRSCTEKAEEWIFDSLLNNMQPMCFLVSFFSSLSCCCCHYCFSTFLPFARQFFLFIFAFLRNNFLFRLLTRNQPIGWHDWRVIHYILWKCNVFVCLFCFACCHSRFIIYVLSVCGFSFLHLTSIKNTFTFSYCLIAMKCLASSLKMFCLRIFNRSCWCCCCFCLLSWLNYLNRPSTRSYHTHTHLFSLFSI